MKRRIVMSVIALIFIMGLGAVLSTLFITSTTENLKRLIWLHQIEHMRQDLVISVQTAQADLYKFNEATGSQLDSVIRDVNHLRTAAHDCSSCHHAPEVAAQILSIQNLVEDYALGMSKYVTATVNPKRLERMKIDTAQIANSLLSLTEDMSVRASERLDLMTRLSLKRLSVARSVLHITIILSLLLGIGIALHLARYSGKPIGELLDATRAITSGNLGYTIPVRDKREFGELATNFNSMSTALRNSYDMLKREIKDRAQTERALRNSEQFLSTVFQSILDPFCVIDRKFTIVKVNEAYAAMKGMAVSDLEGKTCHEALLGRQMACDDCVVHKTFLLGTAASKNKLTVTPEGEKKWFEIYTYPIIDEKSRISHVIEYVRDISEKMSTEEALKESRERYKLAALGANDGLWDWDLRDGTIYLSGRWKAMLGYEESEIGESPDEWFSRIHPHDRAQLEAKMNAHIDGNVSHLQVEHRIRTREGSYLWVLARGLAVRDASGKAYRIAGSQTDITSRKLTEEKLVHDAFHDVLTGLPNRALFTDRLSNAIKRSKRHPIASYAVLFMDIDRFKVINDSLGHVVGDKLLVEVARRLVRFLRPSDTVARMGGDEFAVLLEDVIDAEDVLRVVERIQRELPIPFEVGEGEILTTASIGVAMGSTDYEAPEEILRDADIAMYQAKSKGKACHVIFDSSMHQNVLKRLKIEADLRLAVENNHFLIHYQPIMDLTKEKVIGFEALIRWNHPELGLIYPLEFIPVAEETGLIVPIGKWILTEACRQLSEWQRRFPSDPPLKLSVNISSRQFLQTDLPEQIAGILRQTGVAPACLALEITESIIMERASIAEATLTRLKSMGIHIHIDDFGTGYSSLSYIHRLPVNALKIDRSFISKATESEENVEIVKTIVALARALSLDVIVEGLELAEQVTWVRELECQFGQGFYFSKPMEPLSIELLMQERCPTSPMA